MGATPALAQDVGVQFYRPATSAYRGFGLEGARVLPRLEYASALDVNVASNPLRIMAMPGGRYDAVSHQLAADLVLAMGLGHRVELALALPFILSQAGSPPPGIGAPSAAGVGDARLTAKVALLGPEPRGFSLAGSLTVTSSLGLSRSYVNESGPTLEPRAIAEYQVRRWTVGARIGYRLRSETNLWGTVLGNELTFATGGQVRLGRATRVIGELAAATPASGDFFQRRRSPVEAMLGGRHQIGHLAVGGAAGLGLVSGYGSPSFRLLATVGWASVTPDSDRDGIPDTQDQCVDEPEDRDGFEDSDGCPDPDNDQDGILDFADKCPDDAEDLDSFEDEDGCPDPDNDKDGVLDAADKCPNEPETANGFEDEDGCPDEDKRDTDADGILDKDDKCPTEAEDKDGFEDEDGCPDPDNDKDGVADAADKCPNEPETINGNQDDDGCPDEGKPEVRIGEKELETIKPIFFDIDRARVRRRFMSVLSQIALTLKAHPEIGRCAVEGHTDSTGSEDWNQKLSVMRAKSVVAFLVSKGVEESRLSAIGQGEAAPWAENTTEQGRASNRRVVFHIEGVALPSKPPADVPLPRPKKKPAESKPEAVAPPGENKAGKADASGSTPTTVKAVPSAQATPAPVASPARPPAGSAVAPAKAASPPVPAEAAAPTPARPPVKPGTPAKKPLQDDDLEGKSLKELIQIQPK